MSNSTKFGIGIVVLLLLVPLWNFIAEGAAGAFHPKEKPKTEAPKHEAAVPLPKSMGPATAPVTITVFLKSSNSCHMPSVDLLRKIVNRYPGQVRVVVKDTQDPKVAAKASQAKIGCEMGMLINGRNLFRLPGKGAVTFNGPLDSGKDFTQSDLAMVIDRLILEKTGKPARHADVPAAQPQQPGAQPAPASAPVAPSPATPPPAH
jgi:hypothetical protein